MKPHPLSALAAGRRDLPQQHRVGHLAYAWFAVTLLLAAFPVAAAPAHAQPLPAHPASGCVRHDLRVNLAAAPGATAYRAAGWLCQPRHRTGTVQLLVPGLTYTHRYWTGLGPSTDYVTRALAAGDAVYLIDRVGTGDSDRPPAEQVTTTSEAAVTHQAVQALRDGTLGRFQRVVGVGHSYGSVIWMAAASYRDVDALVLTGLLHDINLDAMTRFTTNLYPAADDPKFASTAAPDGYLTTQPGSRAGYFLDPNTAVPGASAWDETTKATATTGELTFTPDDELRYSRAIAVPVLMVVGATDALFCGPGQPCNRPADICRRERAAFPPGADLSAVTIPATGHSINLHRDATRADTLINAWIAGGRHAIDHPAALISPWAPASCRQ